jgi:hypothetical protein
LPPIFKNKELSFREKAKKTAMIWDEGESLDEAWRAPAAETFLRRLREQRARSFMRDPKYQKSLRHNAEGAKQMQKWFGSIWAEYGTDIYKLIAEACGENWDMEDEQKCSFARETAKKPAADKQKGSSNHDDLAPTCEKDARSGVHQFQGLTQASLGVLEENKGRFKICRNRSPQKAPPQEESRSRRGRRDDFYRSAGGT